MDLAYASAAAFVLIGIWWVIGTVVSILPSTPGMNAPAFSMLAFGMLVLGALGATALGVE